jgi:hypothetical protein
MKLHKPPTKLQTYNKILNITIKKRAINSMFDAIKEAVLCNELFSQEINRLRTAAWPVSQRRVMMVLSITTSNNCNRLLSPTLTTKGSSRTCEITVKRLADPQLLHVCRPWMSLWTPYGTGYQFTIVWQYLLVWITVSEHVWCCFNF